MPVLINSELLGDVDHEESATLTFPHGLLGFEDESSFAVIGVDEDGIYSWLQSTRTPSLAFLTTSPSYFFPNYEPEVADADVAELDLRDPSETLLLCLLTVGDDRVTANLLGPIVVNTRTRMARQVVLDKSSWTTQEPLNGS